MSESSTLVEGQSVPFKWIYDVEEDRLDWLARNFRRAWTGKTALISKGGDRIGLTVARNPNDPTSEFQEMVIDRETREPVYIPTVWLDLVEEGAEVNPREFDLSDDGRYVLVVGGQNMLPPELRRADRQLVWVDTQTDERRSVSNWGADWSAIEPVPVLARMSGDGRTVAYAYMESGGRQRMHMRYYNVDEGITHHVGQVGDRIPVDQEGPSSGDYADASLSYDGSLMALGTRQQLVPEDVDDEFDVYIYDRVSDSYERFGTTTDGRSVQGNCGGPAMTPDGRFVAMRCAAENLAPGFSGWIDVYVWDRVCDSVARVSNSVSGDGGGFYDSGQVDISDDGQTIVFASAASNLVEGDANSAVDIFVAENPLEDCR